MEKSILATIKKLIGPTAEYDHFDQDLINHINSTFMILTQLGVGPPEGFHIEDDTATWNDFLDDMSLYYGVKTYIYQKVRLIFDPPTNSAHINAIEKSIAEFEWRLNHAAEIEAAITTL